VSGLEALSQRHVVADIRLYVIENTAAKSTELNMGSKQFTLLAYHRFVFFAIAARSRADYTLHT
jgi:hypothetical protein